MVKLSGVPRSFHGLVTIALVLALGEACAVRQVARTVGAGRTEVGVIVGGPLQSNLGFPAPIPEHRVHVRGGLTDDLDLDGSIAMGPLTSAILAFDVGFVAQIVRLPRFAASGSIRLNCIYDLDDGFRDTYYPEVGLHLEQRVERWLGLSTGFGLLLQVSPATEHPDLFFAPYLGVEFIVAEHGLSLALSWINPWQTSSSLVRWEPGGAGAIVVNFGWRIQPGGVR